MAGYLIDANLPRYFSLWMADDYQFVIDMDAAWSDLQVWTYAEANGLTIVTKDADFTDRVLLSVDGPGVIHIRTRNLKMKDFHRFLTPIWSDVCELSRACRLVQIYKDRIETIN